MSSSMVLHRATREEVIYICYVAMMHALLRGFAEGHISIPEPQGASLSGSRKQRLPIVRALLRDPAVLTFSSHPAIFQLVTCP
jgi:ABC-type multidrug transport system fused ATPase/permease subunit